MNKTFVHEQLIRFSHCDPAGIVYFPRFFDLAHAVMEDWLADGVGQGLPVLIGQRRIGTPTVSIQCDFAKTLRIGDTLRFELPEDQRSDGFDDWFVLFHSREFCPLRAQRVAFMIRKTLRTVSHEHPPRHRSPHRP